MAYNRARTIFSDTIEKIKQDGLFKQERLICSPQSADIDVRFPADAPEKSVINMCANNYLGLSSHPDVIKAAHEALDSRGYGMSSVRFICGTQDIHRELEKKIAAFLGTEDACLFGSCLDANAALFEVLCTEEDAIISDRLIHASLIDGIRLSKGQNFNYKHANMEHLEEKLQETQTCRMRMIVTDGVFSMDGDMAPLDQICELAEKYDAMVVVDDSHASGFIGKTGRGVHEHFNVMGKVDIITTTFGKGLGGATGGCVAGPKEVAELMKQRGRPYLFSNAVPPPVVMASMKVIELLSKTTERRDKLEKLTEYWRKGLTEAGFDLKAGNTPIVPVMLYNAKLAQEFSKKLYDEGIYAVGFFFPVVPAGQARIRTQISAGHEFEHLDKALAAFKKVGAELGVLGLKKKEILAKFGE
ncbi:MAG: glycine C-acetyltransferase [bacterium]|nr:glycine C-acetyltransferase [bacterium]